MSASRREARGSALRRAALAAALVLTACDGSGVANPGQSTALSLTITAAAGVTADQGRLQIEGAARRTVTLTPGETRDIELPAGSYTVSLEGLTGTVVTGYWERSGVTVTEGRLTSLTASLASFGGPTPTSVATATPNQPFTVQWSPVSGAASYDLEASTSSSFATVIAQENVSGTSAQLSLNVTGTVFFRVRPRTRFNGVGGFGGASAGTQVRAAVQTVEVAPSTALIEVGGNTTFTATLKDGQGNVLTGRSINWQSTNTTVASISQSGVVQGLVVGQTTIRATSEGITGVATLEVVAPGVATVEVTPSSATIPFGGTRDFTATARSATGTVLTGLGVTWSSQDEAVATVNQSGRVLGTGGGTTTIVATIDGVQGGATVTVEAGQPPAVIDYDVFFLPVTSGCGVGYRHFRTAEVLQFADNDGNMNPGRTFAEPLGGPFTTVQSEFREEGVSEWRQVLYEKTWSPTGGSSGSAGGLAANQSTCWNFDNEPTFVDYRVRVRDANGNWSPWLEIRLNMPATVTIVNPGDGSAAEQFSLPVGGSRQFAGRARDMNDVLVPGDPINWSSYTGSDHASISPTGLYTVSPTTAGGLDFVGVRAGYARNTLAGSAAYSRTTNAWFAPGWLDGNISLAQNASISFRMRVYAGRQYVLRTGEDPGVPSSGDIDLYIRFNAPASTSTWDQRSFGDNLNEELTFVAPDDGVLHIFINGFAPTSTGATFSVEGDRTPPTSVEALAVSGARPSGGSAGPPPDAPIDLLLAPASLEGRDAIRPDPVRVPGGGSR